MVGVRNVTCNVFSVFSRREYIVFYLYSFVFSVFSRREYIVFYLYYFVFFVLLCVVFYVYVFVVFVLEFTKSVNSLM